MHAFITLFGPRATWPIVLAIAGTVPVAIWHHVHLVIHVIKHIREEKAEQ